MQTTAPQKMTKRQRRLAARPWLHTLQEYVDARLHDSNGVQTALVKYVRRPPKARVVNERLATAHLYGKDIIALLRAQQWRHGPLETISFIDGSGIRRTATIDFNKPLPWSLASWTPKAIKVLPRTVVERGHPIGAVVAWRGPDKNFQPTIFLGWSKVFNGTPVKTGAEIVTAASDAPQVVAEALPASAYNAELSMLLATEFQYIPADEWCRTTALYTAMRHNSIDLLQLAADHTTHNAINATPGALYAFYEETRLRQTYQNTNGRLTAIKSEQRLQEIPSTIVRHWKAMAASALAYFSDVVQAYVPPKQEEVRVIEPETPVTPPVGRVEHIGE